MPTLPTSVRVASIARDCRDLRPDGATAHAGGPEPACPNRSACGRCLALDFQKACRAGGRRQPVAFSNPSNPKIEEETYVDHADASA